MFEGDVILEVEDPDFNLNSEICKRRVKFYVKNGFVLNSNYKFVQPPMKEVDKKNPNFKGPHLVLMSYKKKIEQDFESVQKIIFEKYYKVNMIE
jgi:hypothetical protein